MTAPTSTERRPLVRRVEHCMGMPISLALRGRDAGTAAGERAWAAAMASLQEADAVFSTYREDSWISRLGRGEVTLGECPPEVAEVLGCADAASLESDGAFGVQLPRSGGGTYLDPSGIVKGWAVDRAAGFLRRLEDTDFCLSAGGDMVCSTAADGTGWRIGIEDPADPRRLIAIVPMGTGGMATSGLTHRGAHIVDPRDGSTPATWASVTILADTLTQADVDATTAFVLGEGALDWIASRPGRAGILVRPDGTIATVGVDRS